MTTSSKQKKLLDFSFMTLTGLAAFFVIVLILGILYVLVTESWLAIQRFGVFHFLITSDWNPVKENFGGFSSIYGTIVTTILSLLFATPIALGIAIFITEIAPNFLKSSIGIAIELLASIPSIIYGMWGLFTLSPIMKDYVEPLLKQATHGIPFLSFLFEGVPRGIDLLTASLILSIMIIPFTASIARDAFNLTPAVVKESAYAMGSTKWEVIKDIIIPYSRLGIFGGVLLSLGRAIGETMAVAFVLGNNHRITTSLLEPASTITVTLANEFAEADNAVHLSALFYLSLVLFVMSFFTLAIAKYFILKVERK